MRVWESLLKLSYYSIIVCFVNDFRYHWICFSIFWVLCVLTLFTIIIVLMLWMCWGWLELGIRFWISKGSCFKLLKFDVSSLFKDIVTNSPFLFVLTVAFAIQIISRLWEFKIKSEFRISQANLKNCSVRDRIEISFTTSSYLQSFVLWEKFWIFQINRKC